MTIVETFSCPILFNMEVVFAIPKVRRASRINRPDLKLGSYNVNVNVSVVVTVFRRPEHLAQEFFGKIVWN